MTGDLPPFTTPPPGPYAAVPALIAHLSRPVHVGLTVPWLVLAAGATLLTLAAVVQAEATPVFCF